MSTYHPKAEHPWRRYKDGKNKEASEPRDSFLKHFFSDLVGSWDDFEVDMDDETGVEYRKIKHMSDEAIAGWLIAYMRKNILSNPHRFNINYDPLVDGDGQQQAIGL